jgi:hypothetical protein
LIKHWTRGTEGVVCLVTISARDGGGGEREILSNNTLITGGPGRLPGVEGVEEAGGGVEGRGEGRVDGKFVAKMLRVVTEALMTKGRGGMQTDRVEEEEGGGGGGVGGGILEREVDRIIESERRCPLYYTFS